jgi:hypothetical protein
MMGLPDVPSLDAAGFAQRTKQLLEIYPRQNVLAQLNLLDSHDMPRFLSMVSGKKEAFPVDDFVPNDLSWRSLYLLRQRNRDDGRA